MTAPGWSNVLLAGVLTGFLPCGLVYGFLGLASSSASIFHGLLTMLAFGAGTAPIMILTGAGGSLLSHSARRHLMRVAAVCVMITGLISLARGVMFVAVPRQCPARRLPLLRTSGWMIKTRYVWFPDATPPVRHDRRPYADGTEVPARDFHALGPCRWLGRWVPRAGAPPAAEPACPWRRRLHPPQ